MKTYIKIKIKSLADESRVIRKEEKKWPGETKVREGLYLHRIKDVASEARAALVAYGFLRGRAYEKVESNPRTKPNWTRVQRIVEKYGLQYFGGNLDSLQQAFKVWKYGH